MNDSSICARWREDHWNCQIGDSLINPFYFSPPVSPDGRASRHVTAFHLTIPRAGWVFEREGLGGYWTRTS